ncbi:hypothetical protein SDC9_123268 [bioreactor metagenome]|uniref:EamA domain-containing protein n=1 Tax=bioreactor metagenome TaxID=1076179 RepID=A0A645CH53_9ZZZZ
MICAFIFESVTLASIKSAAVPIAYGGFFSVGLAYTFQVIGQKNSRPAVAAIVLSLESVTAAIGGALMLKESLGARGVIGCVLIFAGIIASQLKTIALSEAGIKNK